MSSGDRKKTLVPRRYLQNIGALSPREQFRLMESHVLVIGLGGLGGWWLFLVVVFGGGPSYVIDFKIIVLLYCYKTSLTSHLLGIKKLI